MRGVTIFQKQVSFQATALGLYLSLSLKGEQYHKRGGNIFFTTEQKVNDTHTKQQQQDQWCKQAH